MTGLSLIVIGVSAGGLNALATLLRGLEADFPIPIAIVQHRSRDSDALALVLQEYTALRLHEIEDKMAIEPGNVYVAPPDYHTLIDDGHFALSVDAPVVYSRPSIDVLFESAADELGERLAGIVLTGANKDGARGLRRIVQRGGLAIVQDPDSAEVDVMPRAALQQVPNANVVALANLGAFLNTLSGLAA